MQDQYIWKTVGDGKVRPEHAQREGQKFSWKNPPPGGHPGEDYGCRCWAEPVEAKATGLTQTLLTTVNDKKPAWKEIEFVYHGYFGGGRTVTLEETGYLGGVIAKAKEIMFHRVENQVAEKMREIQSGQLVYTTERGYERLAEVFWVLGGGVISTRTEGIVTKKNGILTIQATVNYEYSDIFEDVVNIRSFSTKYFGAKDFSDGFIDFTDGYVTVYPMVAQWKTKLTGSIRVE